MSFRKLGKRNALNRRVPSLPKAAHSGGDSVRVTHDSTAAGENQIRCAEGAPGIGRLPSGLTGRKDRHDFAAGQRWGEHGLQTFLRRGDYAFVTLAELVVEAVDVHVIDARDAPELLIRDVAH